ncbi:hypothetical protein CSB37_03540 [bacterium DOLZORAL124_38_8]|nr:MAG: hypothetical protein CSB37_03540 [bacterium DOLZORAL124_38_8]
MSRLNFHDGSVHSKPLPSHLKVKTFSDKMHEIFPDWVFAIPDFIDEHFPKFFLLVLILIFLKLQFNRKARDRRKIEKAWKFLLFFLSKRQMMIPLVISLAQKNGAISAEQQAQLIQIRQNCQNISLTKNLSQRLEVEETVSRILYNFFEQLEKQGELDKNPRLKKVVSDLEFIDQKLIELQTLYNTEAQKWNRGLWKAFFLRGIKPFTKLPLFQK